jgi:hypothetical protein
MSRDARIRLPYNYDVAKACTCDDCSNLHLAFMDYTQDESIELTISLDQAKRLITTLQAFVDGGTGKLLDDEEALLQ